MNSAQKKGKVILEDIQKIGRVNIFLLAFGTTCFVYAIMSFLGSSWTRKDQKAWEGYIARHEARVAEEKHKIMSDAEYARECALRDLNEWEDSEFWRNPFLPREEAPRSKQYTRDARLISILLAGVSLAIVCFAFFDINRRRKARNAQIEIS